MSSSNEIELVGISELPLSGSNDSEEHTGVSNSGDEEIVAEDELTSDSNDANPLIQSGSLQGTKGASSHTPRSFRTLRFSANLHLMAILGGMTIGYAQAVTGGMLNMDNFLKKFSPSRYRDKMYTETNNYCSYVSTGIQLYVAALPAVVAFSYTVALLCNAKWGNKRVFFCATVSSLVGVMLLQHSPQVGFQVLGILPLGFGMGSLQQATSKLIAELANERIKGRLGLIFSCAQTLGSAVAAGVTWRAALTTGDDGWRAAYLVLGIPLLVLLCFSFFLVTESPQWLLEHKRENEAKETLRQIRDTLDVDYELNNVKKLVEWKRRKNPWKELFNRGNRPALIITTVFSTFPALLGKSIFISYGPLVLQSSGRVVANDSYIINFGVLLAIFIVSSIQPVILSKIGRRTPFVLACLVVLTATCLGWSVFGTEVADYGYLDTYEIPSIVGGFGMYLVGQVVLFGPAGPLKVSFSQSTDEVGATFGVWTSLCFSFVVALFFSRVVCSIRFYIFLVYFGGNMALLFFVWFFAPETVEAETHNVARKVWAEHWFWYKYAEDVEAV